MPKAQIALAVLVAAFAGATAGRVFTSRSRVQEFTADSDTQNDAVNSCRSNPETQPPTSAAEVASASTSAEADGALAEATRLGLVDEVAREQPELSADEVRRLAVALVREARRHRLDPLLLAAVARVESHFDPFAKSDKGALGVMQIRLPTGQELARRSGRTLKRDVELYDIETNVALGARYLARLKATTSSLEEALVAYNHGPAAARRLLDGPDAQDALDGYPRLVLAARDRLAEQARDRTGG